METYREKPNMTKYLTTEDIKEAQRTQSISFVARCSFSVIFNFVEPSVCGYPFPKCLQKPLISVNYLKINAGFISCY
jgi:hypothetical protein